jgi:antitoxin HigA-1
MGKTKKAWTVHPGEILRTEFREPMKITAYRLAKYLNFPGIYDVLRCKRAISAEAALRPQSS